VKVTSEPIWKRTWLDRAVGFVSPQAELKRVRAKAATDLFARTYDAATTGRRTQGWRRSSSDVNSVMGPSLARLRDVARDLVRNNPYAESALNTIVDHTVGWGIRPTVYHAAFERWANSTDCDADGRHDLVGLSKLVMRTTAESGECLVRRRWRYTTDGFALPFQLQVMEPDFLDTLKDGATQNGGRIVQGVEVDAVGYVIGYWLFKDHPGSSTRPGGSIYGQSRFVPASEIAHVFKSSRPGQMRAVTWFAQVLLRFKDFDEFEDATLMKQKIAACLAVITSDVDGSAAPLGAADASADPVTDTLEPGMIMNVAPGRRVDVVQPPSVGEYSEYTKTTLHAIATGLGVTYEDLTGDYQNLPFSAARMSRIRHRARVEDWQYRLLIPQFLDRVWGWAMEASELAGLPVVARTDWTPPGMAMIEPDKEGLAAMRNVRSGISTLSDEIRQRGFNPDTHLAELAKDFAKLDALKLTLDCDPRKMSQQGQMHPPAAYPAIPKDEKTDDEAA
jgi:lambda family phage portal protein